MRVWQSIRALCIGCLLLAAVSTSYAWDNVYPAGSGLLIDYRLKDTIIAPTDTLVITRTLINHAGFTVDGLYFSDWIPRNFRLVSHGVKRNGVTVTSSLSADSTGAVGVNLVGYYWVTDEPGSVGTNLVVANGDTVILTAKLMCNTPGTYQLPMHTSVCHNGNAGGFFATSSAQRVQVRIATDVEDDHGLPTGYLLSEAYPNPFNATVTITYRGEGIESSSVSLVIYNALGQEVHIEQVTANSDMGAVEWTPDPAIGTGIYFYRLTSLGRTGAGKLVLLK